MSEDHAQPLPDPTLSSGGRLTPLQAELLAEGHAAQRDVLSESLPRADIAPEAGYMEGGPIDQVSPELEAAAQKYEGILPVFQWEIDPSDAAAETGEKHIHQGVWEYDIWWQVHPAELVYVSIQAMRDDPVSGGPERKHPMGRNVVVNLVYDIRRQGVLSVYGTARDFRPFVEAFREAYGLEQDSETESAQEQENAQ